MDGGIIIADELEYINENIIKKCILPLYTVDNVCFIGITTPSGRRDGFCSRIMQAMNEYGENPFSIAYTKTVCDDCIGTEKESGCKHIYSEPAFHNEEKKRDISLLYDKNDNTAKIEMMAVTNDNIGYAFDSKKLLKFESERTPIDVGCKYVFVGIDTSGISSSSETAIVSLYYNGMNISICGIDSQVCKDDLISDALIKKHIQGILNTFGSNIKIIVIPEIYAKNACMLSRGLSIFDNIYIPFQKIGATFNAGVVTTNMTKQEGVAFINFALISDAITICDNVITNSWNNENTRFTKSEENVNRLIMQMKGFEEIIQTSRNSKQTFVYSGKKNGDGKDDIVMALNIVVYWSRMIKTKKIDLRSSKQLNTNINKFIF